MSILDQVRREALSRALQVEQLPPLPGSVTDAELSSYRYPFERDLVGYLRKLPDLGSVLLTARRVLDIGAGRGLALAEIRAQYKCDVVATGISQTADALVPLTVCTAVDLPFPDNSFDLVISVQSISWEPDQLGAFREITRVLQPGGVGLHFLTAFSYSVDHRYGDSFWVEAGIERQDYIAYEFSPKMQIEGASLSITPIKMKHPYGIHRFAYYVKQVRS